MKKNNIWIVMARKDKAFNEGIVSFMENNTFTTNQLSDNCSINGFRLEKMSDFCRLVNSRELDLSLFWWTYVHIKL